jgi:hypothetical protein
VREARYKRLISWTHHRVSGQLVVSSVHKKINWLTRGSFVFPGKLFDLSDKFDQNPSTEVLHQIILYEKTQIFCFDEVVNFIKKHKFYSNEDIIPENLCGKYILYVQSN